MKICDEHGYPEPSIVPCFEIRLEGRYSSIIFGDNFCSILRCKILDVEGEI